MAEIMEEKKELTPAETAAPASPETPAKRAEKSTADKKKRRRTIRRIVALVVVAALIAGGVKFFKKKDGSSEVGMATVSYGAISSEVDGSGLVKAKNSETISLTTAGTVMDVFVEEGQKVEQGDPLFTIDSPNAATEVQKARDEVEGYQKQINTLQKDIAGLNLSPSYAGKLMDVVTLNPGDEISKGTKVAVLADDTRMRLEQYYSYAYAGEMKAGQKVQVSIPALMTTVEGTVEAVHMVSRITPEGSKLFSAEIVIPNEGVLAKDMVATATTIVNGDIVYPYEAAKLQYYRVGDLNSTVSGHRTAESGRGPEEAGGRPEESGQLQCGGSHFRSGYRSVRDAGAGTSGKQHPCDRFRHLHRDHQRHRGRAEHQLYQDRHVREPGPVGHQRLRHGGDGEPFQHCE
ncbi:MAG: HlyD family efflux transporter periplasmic adaptor subunit [Oscillibacter sp.]|nr:HlyD family efflux transporter periplasmic adaptor subunit [Oscillibacter sp.]